ncbi:MAG: hypothetical protein JO257_36585 [Deltaproteobacteria bacterium]|nr:hypothetical protein [Deltaproteobacteria bacterium]
MTAAVALAAVPAAPRTLSPFPSAHALRLEQTPMHELEKEFVRGGTPDLEDLVGWEFRGINHMPLNVVPFAQLVGIKKFVKGFFREGDRVMGYNRPVARNVLDGRWHVADKRFGFYEVHEVDATSTDNKYLHAVLLDYGRGGNKPLDPTAGLRDYLVQLADDIYLGKAYYAVGPLRVPTNFFILERHAVGLTDYERR